MLQNGQQSPSKGKDGIGTPTSGRPTLCRKISGMTALSLAPSVAPYAEQNILRREGGKSLDTIRSASAWYIHQHSLHFTVWSEIMEPMTLELAKNRVQPTTAQCSQIQPSTTHYSLIQPNIAQYSPVQPNTAHYSPLQPSTANNNTAPSLSSPDRKGKIAKNSSLPVSLWLNLALSLSLCLAQFSSLWRPLWLLMATTGSLRVLLALFGSYWH